MPDSNSRNRHNQVVSMVHINISFSNNKSPGNDGITIEFYRHFWDAISLPLIQCFNFSYDHGELSNSQRQAIICLLEKAGKDRQYIKNWRPISLLNVDYKILTKTLSNRIKAVLLYIININQTGYVEGRKLCYSVRYRMSWNTPKRNLCQAYCSKSTLKKRLIPLSGISCWKPLKSLILGKVL